MRGADGHVADVRLSAAIQAAQRGDDVGFRTVYRSVHPRLLAYVRTLVGRADAEDVTSEAWLQIARDLDRFQGDADRFRGWTARIARNRALDHLRRLGRRPSVVEGGDAALLDLPAPQDTASEALEVLSTDRALALIARLPREQAEAVVLRVVVGLDTSSAARVLGKRQGAVRTAAHRGLRRLARMLQEPSEADPQGATQDATGRPNTHAAPPGDAPLDQVLADGRGPADGRLVDAAPVAGRAVARKRSNEGPGGGRATDAGGVDGDHRDGKGREGVSTRSRVRGRALDGGTT